MRLRTKAGFATRNKFCHKSVRWHRDPNLCTPTSASPRSSPKPSMEKPSQALTQNERGQQI
eukprot:2573911-Amphidinium_carterae.2